MLACLGYAGSPFSLGSNTAGDYLVDIYVNANPTEVLADLRIDKTGRAYVPAQYLREAGFNVDDEGEVEIGANFPIDYRFDENDQKLDLYQAEENPKLSRYELSAAPELSRELPAIILDYGLSYQRVNSPNSTHDTFFGNADIIATRNGWVFDHSMVVNASDSDTDIIRLQTLFERDFYDNLTRLSVGDNFYRAPSWGRRSTFVGVQYGRDFSLRPEDNQRPFAQLQTLLKEESEIEVVVNGVTQDVRTVNPGVELITPEQADGVNLVQVRIRDALGVERVENLNFFSARSALAKGVHDYSFSAGVPRTFNGLENNYEDYLIGTATSRYGVNNWFTLETAAEVSGRVNTAGAGGLFTLNSLGALSLSLSASDSRSEGFGTQLRAGFERRSQNGSIQAQARFASSDYSDLASEKGVPFADRQWFVRASRRTDLGNFRLTYNERNDDILSKRSFLTAGWDYNIKNGPALFANSFKDFAQDSFGFSLGLRYAWDKYYSRAALESAGYLQRASVNAGKSRAGRNDWQYSAFASAGDGPALIRGDASYLSDYGEYYASASKLGSTNDFAVGTRGSVIGVSGNLSFREQIGDSFALVKTPGLPGQTVFKDFRDIGKTNKNGEILVTNLRPFQSNTISISPDQISLDYTVGNTSIDVVPPRRGVVEATFDITADSSLSFEVLETDGKTIELGLTVGLKNAGTRSVVGYGGRAFLSQADEDDIVQIFGKDLLAEMTVKELRQSREIFVTTGPHARPELEPAAELVAELVPIPRLKSEPKSKKMPEPDAESAAEPILLASVTKPVGESWPQPAMVLAPEQASDPLLAALPVQRLKSVTKLVLASIPTPRLKFGSKTPEPQKSELKTPELKTSKLKMSELKQSTPAPKSAEKSVLASAAKPATSSMPAPSLKPGSKLRAVKNQAPASVAEPVIDSAQELLLASVADPAPTPKPKPLSPAKPKQLLASIPTPKLKSVPKAVVTSVPTPKLKSRKRA